MAPLPTERLDYATYLRDERVRTLLDREVARLRAEAVGRYIVAPLRAGLAAVQSAARAAVRARDAGEPVVK